MRKTGSDLAPADKFFFLRYGEHCNPDALSAVHAIHNALLLKTDPPDPSIEQMLRDEAWQIIAEHYLQDWAKHDGSFFSDMGRAMEVHMRAAEPCYVHVASEIIQREAIGRTMPTAKEMHKIVAQAGCDATIKTVRRAFEFWGTKPSPDRRGAPKGKPHKRLYRAR